jgi:branched-subunit amino acid ABC-type transport system permease component
VIWIQYAIFGLGVGGIFALLASGIVLVYRATGMLNFAHASMAMTAAYVNFTLLERVHGMPVGVALLITLAFGAVLGVVIHRFVYVPVASSSQVVKLIVSFGLAGVLQGAVGLIWGRIGTPPVQGRTLLSMDRGVSIAGAEIPAQRVALLAVGIGVSIGLAWLLARTEFGMRIRALAQNPLAARLAGVDDRRVQRRVWAIAGATAALAGVLIVPFGALTPLALSGFQLKALAAALVGGFASLPAALGGALGIGIVQELLVGAPSPFNGLRSVLATAVVLALLFARIERYFVSRQEALAIEGDERLAIAGKWRAIGLGSPAGWVAGFGLIALVTLGLSGFWSFVAARTLVYALLGLSLVVLTGWSGQVSLMPGTFAGVGACFAWILGTKLGLPFVMVVPLAALATVPVSLVAGAAALRLRPLYLAVATVALAGLFEETLFHQGWFANAGAAMTVARPGALSGDHPYTLAIVGVVGAVFFATAAFGRSRTGRALRMVRDNDRAAAAAGVNPTKYRLLAFSLSAAYAGLAGALLAYLLGTFSSAAFSFLVLSLATFGLATIGGIRAPLGALLGAFTLVYLSEVFRTTPSINDWVFAGVGAGIIAVMARSPDGLVGLAHGVAERVRAQRSPREPDWIADEHPAPALAEATHGH